MDAPAESVVNTYVEMQTPYESIKYAMSTSLKIPKTEKLSLRQEKLHRKKTITYSRCN